MTQAGATLKLHNLNATLDGIPRLLDANAHFFPGTPHVAVGRSGAGKSVLLKCGLGLLPLTSGETELTTHEGSDKGSCFVRAGDDDGFKKLRQKAVLVLQDPALLDDLNVVENLEFVMSRVGRKRKQHVEAGQKKGSCRQRNASTPYSPTGSIAWA
ncbi:MAG: ATP-binding cassette domain-containing protein [Deltaproteobacteria bacterium]|nr:ATP-binding cassette domain-containing protein [Deltaproteobacteria bacterium]